MKAKWTNIKGEKLVIADLSADYLINIARLLYRTNRVNKSVDKELRKRQLYLALILSRWDILQRAKFVLNLWRRRKHETISMPKD